MYKDLESFTGVTFSWIPIWSPSYFRGCHSGASMLLFFTALNLDRTISSNSSKVSLPDTLNPMMLEEYHLFWKLISSSRILMSFSFVFSHKVHLLPVPNLEYGWDFSISDLPTMRMRHASICRFFWCSDSMALISFSVNSSVYSGAMKNWANLSRALLNLAGVISK